MKNSLSDIRDSNGHKLLGSDCTYDGKSKVFSAVYKTKTGQYIYNERRTDSQEMVTKGYRTEVFKDIKEMIKCIGMSSSTMNLFKSCGFNVFDYIDR